MAGQTFRVDGGADLQRVAARLKEAGRRDLRLQMLRELRTAAKPAKDAVIRSAGEELPKAGGYAAIVQQSTVTRTRLTGKSANVRVQVVHQDYRVNKGLLRHPVFGRKDQPWVTQDVPPGWFTRPLLALAPMVRDRMVRVIQATARRALK